MNDGNGLSDAPVIIPLPNDTHTVSDSDGNGNLDVAGPASVFLGKGDGSFQKAVKFAASSPASTEVALAADFNNDKAPDLVLIDGIAGTNMISVMLNSGTDFRLAANPLSPSSIGAGQSTSSTVNVQLLNLFDNPVSLTCSVQPAQSGAPTCSFNADSVTFDSSGKATATLIVSAGSLALLNNRGPWKPVALMWFPVAGVALLGS
jgi:hypothetical protein